MARNWRFTPHDRGLVAQHQPGTEIVPRYWPVFWQRAVTMMLVETKEFSGRLRSRICTTRHAFRASKRRRIGLSRQCRGERRITVYGDYDVDGVTATSILWHCLKLAGANVDYYIPCRMAEGYGLNAGAIRQLHEEDPRSSGGDCRLAESGAWRKPGLARELGMELIVTDHHTLSEKLPEAACIVHPRRPGGDYPFPDLCGAGVAFKLAWAVCQRLGDGKRASPAMREFLKSAVGLAAMGTVADVVPLVGENRIFVKHGLRVLHEMRMVGLGMLIKVAGLDSKPELTAEDIGFGLAPRINAAGRLGQARLAVELLTTEDRGACCATGGLHRSVEQESPDRGATHVPGSEGDDRAGG